MELLSQLRWTKYADVVSFEFKDNFRSDLFKRWKENYLWKFKHDLIEITALDTQNF
jgi:hypothetical protein